MDISTLEDETTILSQNGGHQLPSDMTPHPRITDTLSTWWFNCFTW